MKSQTSKRRGWLALSSLLLWHCSSGESSEPLTAGASGGAPAAGGSSGAAPAGTPSDEPTPTVNGAPGPSEAQPLPTLNGNGGAPSAATPVSETLDGGVLLPAAPDAAALLPDPNAEAPAPLPAGSLGNVVSGVPWLDTDGNLVNAHGVGFLQVGSTYYMVGEQRSGSNDTYSGEPINAEDTFTGVSLYSTTDFINWTFVGTVVKPIPGTVVAPPYYGERPKILYNAATDKYVIYIKMLNYTGVPPVYVGEYAVLSSTDIAGPYEYQGTLGLAGASDFQVFQDTDGAQYLVRDGGILYRFSEDALRIAGTVRTGIQSGEGPSLYKVNGVYFWQSSQGTYWHANDNSYSTATALLGPWTAHGFFSPPGTKTWQSQDTAVVTIAGTRGTTYMYVGDRWVNGDLPASTLVVQPLTVNGTSESIPNYIPIWHLDVAAGTWEAVNPTGTTVNDSVTGAGQNQFNYGAGWAAGARGGNFGNDAHSSATPGATANIDFTGSQVLLYSAYDGNSGIMGVTLEDSAGSALRPELNVSLFSDAPAAGNYLVYASPVMPLGSYRLRVRITGRKDNYSSGTAGNIDRVLIVGGN